MQRQLLLLVLPPRDAVRSNQVAPGILPGRLAWLDKIASRDKLAKPCEPCQPMPSAPQSAPEEHTLLQQVAAGHMSHARAPPLGR